MSHLQRPDQSATRYAMGQWGETLVSQWLQRLGWTILHQRWRCRWGELDIVAQTPAPAPMLIMVEVKVRNQHNWDHDGMRAITPQKQAKLLRAAELFLSEHGDISHYPCRFDIALVQRRPIPKPHPYAKTSAQSASHIPNGSAQAGTRSPSDSEVFLPNPAAIASFVGSTSAPTQALKYHQVPSVCVGHEILRLQHYIEAAFDGS